MRHFTHCATAASGLIVSNFLFGTPEITPAQIGIAIAATTLVDLDSPSSRIRKVLGFFLPFDFDFLEHRGTLHSFFLGILISLVSFRFLPDFWVSISIGFFLHLLGDLFQKPGVKLIGFYKLRSRFTISLGSRNEYIFLLVTGLLPITFFFLVVQPAGGFRLLILEQIGSFRAAAELIQAEPDFQYSLRIQNPRLVISGEFPFVHTSASLSPSPSPSASASGFEQASYTGLFDVIACREKQFILRHHQTNKPISVWDNSKFELLALGKVKVIKKESVQTFSKEITFQNLMLDELFKKLRNVTSNIAGKRIPLASTYFINGSIILRKPLLLTSPVGQYQTIHPQASGKILKLSYFILEDVTTYFGKSDALPSALPSKINLAWVEEARLNITFRIQSKVKDLSGLLESLPALDVEGATTPPAKNTTPPPSHVYEFNICIPHDCLDSLMAFSGRHINANQILAKSAKSAPEIAKLEKMLSNLKQEVLAAHEARRAAHIACQSYVCKATADLSILEEKKRLLEARDKSRSSNLITAKLWKVKQDVLRVRNNRNSYVADFRRMITSILVRKSAALERIGDLELKLVGLMRKSMVFFPASGQLRFVRTVFEGDRVFLEGYILVD